jgi:DNA-binding NtrC family response regulator
MTNATIACDSNAVLVASSDAALRQQLIRSLQTEGGSISEACGGADALGKLEEGNCKILFLDSHLPDLDAEELQSIVRSRHPKVEVVIVNAAGQPVLPEPQRPRPENTLSPISPLKLGTESPCRESISEPCFTPIVESLPGMVGESPVMQKLYRMARLVAPRTTTVLIMGPTGSGKELVARALHELSPRRERPLVTVNCAAIPEALLESELFGYVRGAFTGAVQSHAGKIHAALGGTLFLDEVGELPLAMQAKLLRFLEQKEVQRLGSNDVVRMEVRVIAATNASLAEKVAAREFRQDLFYRLSAFPLTVPPLADRKTDIVPLAMHFLGRCAGDPPALTDETVDRLESYSWPGNVRELQQVLERAVILAEGASTLRRAHVVFTSARQEAISREKCPSPEIR